VRILTILCSGIVAFSLASAPASADPSTPNTVFAVFDFGGFSTDGTGEQYYEEGCEPSNLLVVNLASIEGTIEDFIALHFNEIDFGDEYDLSQVSYFILGHIYGTDHLVLSDVDGAPAPLPGAFPEMNVIDGIQNMGDLGGGQLGDPGGMLFITPGQFQGQLGVPIDTFTTPGNLPFDPVGTVGGEADLLGFTEPVFLTRTVITFENGILTGAQVPEPGLALLAVLGIAGTVITRRRRRHQTA